MCSDDLQLKSLSRLKLLRGKNMMFLFLMFFASREKNDVNICVLLTHLVKSPRDKLSDGTVLHRIKSGNYFLWNLNLSTDNERSGLVWTVSQKSG